jgi:hypothetical protein
MISASLNAALAPSSLGRYPEIFYILVNAVLQVPGQALTAGDEMWDRSAATPGVLTTSYSASSEMSGEVLRRRDRGWRLRQQSGRYSEGQRTCPIPPEAPATTVGWLDRSIFLYIQCPCVPRMAYRL